MNVDKLIRKSDIFLKRHSPTILTCIGAVGAVATGVLAAASTSKAIKMLEEAKEEKQENPRCARDEIARHVEDLKVLCEELNEILSGFGIEL